MRWFKTFLIALLLACLVSSSFLTSSAWAEESSKSSLKIADSEVVTLGADLSESQQNKMLDTFGVERDDPKIKILKITNAEERQHLKGLVPDEQIGTKAISCAHVKILQEGSGINVKTKNITYVTKQAYANALVTAKIKDAEVFAAAPFPVSGTAALTGLFRAYEEATGNEISEEAKKVATEELVTTSEIGKEIGEEERVSELVSRVKEKVVGEGLEDPQEIEEVVQEVAEDLDINLSPDQKDEIVELMQKIGKLDLDIGMLKEQLEGIRSKLKGLLGGEETSSFWEKVIDFFVNLWDKIRAIFK